MNQLQKVLGNYSITHFSSEMLVATVQMLHSTMTQSCSFTISSLHAHFEHVFGRWLEFHFCPCCCCSWAIAAGPGAVVVPWPAGPAGPSHCRGQRRAWWPRAQPSGPCGRRGATQQDSSQTQACLELIQVFSHSGVQTCFLLVSAAHLLLFCVRKEHSTGPWQLWYHQK